MRIVSNGGVPEYWIVDPVAHTMIFLRLADGIYHAQQLGADGRYRPAQLPGLTCVPARLWDRLSHPDQRWLRSPCGVFEVVPPAPADYPRSWETSIAEDEDLSLPFAPVIGRQPRPITFAQYIAWCVCVRRLSALPSFALPRLKACASSGCRPISQTYNRNVERPGYKILCATFRDLSRSTLWPSRGARAQCLLYRFINWPGIRQRRAEPLRVWRPPCPSLRAGLALGAADAGRWAHYLKRISAFERRFTTQMESADMLPFAYTLHSHPVLRPTFFLHQ